MSSAVNLLVSNRSMGLGVIRLILKGSRRAIGFDLASIGELQFFLNILRLCADRYSNDLIYIFHHQASQDQFDKLCPELVGRVIHIPFKFLCYRIFRKLDLFITTEQFIPGPPTVCTLTVFHGQPSKGVTFGMPTVNPLESNDAMFLYGPLHRQALQEHLDYWGNTLPSHLSLFNIGYSKSDDLINGKYNQKKLLKEMELNIKNATILYAPAFNEGASLREYGTEILETLCSLKQFNILVKLAIDCLRPTSDFYATGGVDWFKTIAGFEQEHSHFRLVRSLEADPALACSDILITCVSSIGFEFLAIGRPVIYIDTPKFFEQTLESLFPGSSASSWSNRTAINGGREFGLVVSHPRELPDAINKVLMNPELYPKRRPEIQQYLLYNPGKATEAAVDQIDKILTDRVRSSCPVEKRVELLGRSCGYLTIRRKLARKLRALWGSNIKWTIDLLLNRFGYRLTRTGLEFVAAKRTIAAAQKMGLSVCEYMESLEDHPQKKGRRDYIVKKLIAAGVLDGITTVCEIGAGTGRYLEKVIAFGKPKIYEVYETNQGWVNFLKEEYGYNAEYTLQCRPADGSTLRFTPSDCCELVHAHGVFVYLPLLQTMEYLKECVRVCRPGGYIVFDCFLDKSFTLSAAQAWLAGPYRFPVVIPEVLLDEFVRYNDLRLVQSFPVIYGASCIEYQIWQKPSDDIGTTLDHS